MINSTTNTSYNFRAIMNENIKSLLTVIMATAPPLYLWVKDYATPLVLFISAIFSAGYMYYNFRMKKLEYEKAKRRDEIDKLKGNETK